MELFETLEFLLIMSIPVVGGFFLYNGIKWNKFSGNSVFYGCVYAFVICVVLITNARYGFLLSGCNKVQYGRNSQTYVQCINNSVNANALIGSIKADVAKNRICTIKKIFVEQYRGHNMLVCVYSGKLPIIIENQHKTADKNEMLRAGRKK